MPLLFRNFIEQISYALDDLHEHDQNHDGVCHYIWTEALKAVANRHVATPTAADRACHSRKSDDDDKRQSNRADDARQRLDEHHAKDYLRLLAPKLFAASITPLPTSSRALSMRRAIKGAEPIVSGTIAAVVPILVPTRSFVIWRYEIPN